MKRFRKGRLPAEFNLLVETANGPAMMTVVDVTEYGMRLCGNCEVEVGDDITATLTDWEVSGVIKWVRRPYCGVLFDSRAPSSAVSEMRGKAVRTKRPGFRRIRLSGMPSSS